jgi:LuxR family maltose regulon positive regulatory protein
VQVALALGDLDAAGHWAERLGERPDFVTFYPLLRLTPVRLLLAQGHPGEAAEHAQAAHALASRAGWQYGALEARVWQALAAPSLDQALIYLADALSQAEPEGYVRTFADKGPPLAALLREAAVRGIAPACVGRLLSTFVKPSGAPREDSWAGIPEQPLPEPLSGRELQALGLVAEGLSNQEIALAMFISLNTVKTHLKSAYSKLGVHQRREAVARARHLKLLP